MVEVSGVTKRIIKVVELKIAKTNAIYSVPKNAIFKPIILTLTSTAITLICPKVYFIFSGFRLA